MGLPGAEWGSHPHRGPPCWCLKLGWRTTCVFLSLFVCFYPRGKLVDCSALYWLEQLLGCFLLPVSLLLSGKGLRMDSCPEICSPLLSQDQRLAQLSWSCHGLAPLEETRLGSPWSALTPLVWDFLQANGDTAWWNPVLEVGLHPQPLTARGKQFFCFASLLPLAPWGTNSALPSGSGEMVMPALPKASALLAAWLWKSFEETWNSTAQTSP